MIKIVINKVHGGFGLSEKAIIRIAELKGITLYPKKENNFSFVTYWKVPEIPSEILNEEQYNKASREEREYSNKVYEDNTFDKENIERDDPNLIQVIEELGEEADGEFARLSIVEIPDGVDWKIEEYDGMEWIAEQHRTWG